MFFEDFPLIWEALDSIGSFIKKCFHPNVAALRAQGDLVTKTSAITPEGVFFGVTYQTGQDGNLEVFSGERLLHDAALIQAGAFLADDDIELAQGVLVESGAMLKGPTLIGPRTQVRQGAYVRGQVLTLEDCIVGHATEAKNIIMLKGAKAGHFAYLGDSILGANVNLGAGTKLANLKMLDSPFRFKVDGQEHTVKRHKFGAILGDGVETGCNSVTSPGVMLGPSSKVLPNVTVKGGYYGRRTIIRSS
jgi:bifunctional N-acetylglucosamine-1-phosphate-uridyltransferase/glucosamine-1-phosphate-acetyltransferase GlmU-like protein